MARHREGGSGPNEARSALRQAQQRKSMGDEAYERMVAEGKSRGFVWFGLAFVIVLGIVFFTMT